jgi:autotransporter-associated beta strand protein
MEVGISQNPPVPKPEPIQAVKPRFRFIAYFAAAFSLVAFPSATAGTLFWDGGTTNIGTDGDGASTSAAGTWDNTIQNWDVGAAPHVAWNNTTNASDTASFFASGNYTVTINSDITLGGLSTSWSGATRTLSLSSTTRTLNFSPGSIIDNTAGSTTNYGVLSITAGISGAPTLNIRTFSNGVHTLNPSSGLGQQLGAVSFSLGAASDVTLNLQGASNTTNSMSSLTMTGNGSNRAFFTKSNDSTWSIGNVVSTTSAASGRVTLRGYQGLLKFTGDMRAQTLEIGNGALDNATVEFTKASAILEIDNVTLTGGILKNSSGGPLTFTTSIADNTNNNRIGSNGIRFEGGDMVFESNRVMKLNSAICTIDVMTARQTVSFNGNVTNITAGNALTKEGAGTLLLAGTSSYTGATTVNAGTLLTTRAAALASYSTAGRVIFNGGTVGVRVGGAGWTTVQVDSLLSASTKTSGALGIDTTNGDVTQWTAFTTTNMGSALGLTKLGTNKLILDQANSYVGPTSVNEGTLIINGSTSSTSLVSVGVNGTLGGNGTVGGNTTIYGTHNPGNSPGIQTFGGNLAYVDGGTPDPTVNWELVDNTTTLGVNPTASFDQIIVGGNMDFTNLTMINLIFNGVGSLVDWDAGLWDANQSWLLYDVAGTTSNFGNLSLNTVNWLDKDGALFSTTGGAFSLGQSGQDVILNYSIIPEPNAAALLGALGALLLLRRRR